MRKSIILFILCISIWPAFAEEAANYCKDEASWAEWNTLVGKYPGDDNFMRSALDYAQKLNREAYQWKERRYYSNVPERS